jgi:hypothetical protein
LSKQRNDVGSSEPFTANVCLVTLAKAKENNSIAISNFGEENPSNLVEIITSNGGNESTAVQETSCT